MRTDTERCQDDVCDIVKAVIEDIPIILVTDESCLQKAVVDAARCRSVDVGEVVAMYDGLSTPGQNRGYPSC